MARMTRESITILVCVLLVAGIAIGSVAPAVTATALAGTNQQELIDDFEDENIVIENEDYTGWNGSTGFFSVNTTDPINGTASGELNTTTDTTQRVRYNASSSTPENASFKMRVDHLGSSWEDDEVGFRYWDRNTMLFSIDVLTNETVAYSTNSGAQIIPLANYTMGEPVDVNLEFNWTNNSVTVDLAGSGVSETGTIGTFEFGNTANHYTEARFRVDTASGDGTGATAFIDDVRALDGSVSGNVVDDTGAGIDNATVKAKQNGNEIASTTTNSKGKYDLSLEAGNYTLAASKDGYHDEEANITYNGGDLTQDFTLINKSQRLDLEATNFLEQGDTHPYTVYYYERDNETGILERSDVTQAATVTSNDTNALTINTTSTEFEATDNTSINVIVHVTAEYTTDNETFTDEQNVTVASLTLDNIKILPETWRLNASLGNDSMFAILIATLVGIVGARASTSFGGLSLMTMAIIVAWFGGFTSTGIMLVTVFTATFIGLNVAANIDYGIHR